MSNLYDEGFNDGYKAAKQDYRVDEVHAALVDAAVMLSDIERARQLPPTAAAQRQYVALGRQIMALLRVLPHDAQSEAAQKPFSYDDGVSRKGDAPGAECPYSEKEIERSQANIRAVLGPSADDNIEF